MKQGNSRVCLGGEDLDWCGGKSIQLPIKLRTTSKFSPNKNFQSSVWIYTKIREKSYTLKTDIEDIEKWNYEGSFWDYIVAALNSFRYFTGILPCGILNIVSDIPEKSGLCSSASLFMSIFKELGSYYNLHLTSDVIVEMAFYAENKIIGATVGKMDYYASLTESIFLYDSKSDSISEINYSGLSQIIFYVVYSGEMSSSKRVNKHKLERYLLREEDFLNYIKKANMLVENFSYDLKNDCSIMTFGNYLERFQDLMRNYLRVSTSNIDNLIENLKHFGAVGSKITGCGLGGYIVSVVPKEKMVYFEENLKRVGVNYIKC